MLTSNGCDIGDQVRECYLEAFPVLFFNCLLMKRLLLLLTGLMSWAAFLSAQPSVDSSLLTLDQIFASNKFQQESSPTIRWVEAGNSYISASPSSTYSMATDLIRTTSADGKSSVFIAAESLIPPGTTSPLQIADFQLSSDETKVLIFTNTSRVWRRNTKGDYWFFHLQTRELRQLGAEFKPSSLMFAKFSPDNQSVSYVQDFNLYEEHLMTGEITQLTTDGNRDIINGTFDWVYEEEFGCRDGFRYSPEGNMIAYWQVDASNIGTFYMINNTDSIYSKIIPLQYPKVGEDPSATKVGIVTLSDQQTTWIDLPGGLATHYIPGMQWIHEDLLLIQQINRYQNDLRIFTYQPSGKRLKEVYREQENSWVDLSYPDITANSLSENEMILGPDGESVLRMTETDGWRHLYLIHLPTGTSTLLTPGNYDVASMLACTKDRVYFSASPGFSPSRFLYSVDLSGSGDSIRHSPQHIMGVHQYNISPNGSFAIHQHQSSTEVSTSRMIRLPDHSVVRQLVTNGDYREKLNTLRVPTVSFFSVTVAEGVVLDGRMMLPHDFNPNYQYPVLFHVYGEPWGQTAVDRQPGLWNTYLTQQGYIVINVDPRGTPCLKGSAFRKSIYRNIGRLNIEDLAEAARQVAEWEYIDKDRMAVWGWSGGGSSTLNLMFQYPGLFSTGIAVAAVPDQRLYDNVYQERYMGLPQDHAADFVAGSPVTHARHLSGNLMIIHGTADDNVHYQGMEVLINELIAHNKYFQMMSYPNRSHGIYEGANTRRHVYTTIADYLMKHVKPGGQLHASE